MPDVAKFTLLGAGYYCVTIDVLKALFWEVKLLGNNLIFLRFVFQFFSPLNPESKQPFSLELILLYY